MIQLRDYQQTILNQIYESMRSGNKRPLVQAPCGSGKTVIFAELARLTQLKNNNVIVLVHRRELFKQTEQTFKLAGIKQDRIQIHMAQTYSRHLAEYEKPDLIITDESHMAASMTWRRIYDHWPDAYVVGFSASPARLDGKPLGAIFDDLIIGPSVSDLIQRGYLADYRYYSIDVADLTALKRKGSDYDMADADSLLSVRAVYGDVLKTFRERANKLRTVAYCTTIKHSQKTAEQFRLAGYRAEHIDGDLSTAERDAVIERFRTGETQILTNCQIIDVGFDLPAIECCMMLRPTASTALYIQQSGRALRPIPGKTAVILDFVGNYTRHGLPDDDRSWSLTDTIKPAQQKNTDGSFLIRQCRSCLACYKSALGDCPICGEVYRAGREEIKSIRDAELREIRKNEERRQNAWKKKRMEKLETESDCRSYQDLILFAKKMGHTNPKRYAIHRSHALGFRLPWSNR